MSQKRSIYTASSLADSRVIFSNKINSEIPEAISTEHISHIPYPPAQSVIFGKEKSLSGLKKKEVVF